MEAEVFETTFIGAHYIGPYPGLNESIFTLYLNNPVYKDDILLLENGQYVIVKEDSAEVLDEWEGELHQSTEVMLSNIRHDPKSGEVWNQYNGIEWWDRYIDPEYLKGGRKFIKVSKTIDVLNEKRGKTYKKRVLLVDKIEEPVIKQIKVIEA